MDDSKPSRHTRRIILYRTDSTMPVNYERVKSTFWTADGSVFTIAQYTDIETGAHRYIHWLREHFVWFTDEREE